ncbi:hypothetical protein DENIS_0837 [Desulfonema ishimotonii]|uniref:Orc1-like AAA ATPase domain-containing protein n=1 Tax=Desulfonema ishimotonii TaxID=45657 RepID=A0A401FSG0_9BACT|nr:hypothetical protein [Desulfonema ishimotonii]GBC59895.1 hypothetical protein DENIS_0837 [Desulfonema ishimotonii]
MDFKTRKKYYNRCNPIEPLEPHDPRNLDIDAFGKESGHRVRGINWADRLMEEIALSDQPVCKLFTGLPGSGKSTELLRLSQCLRTPDESNLFTVYINAEDFIDLHRRTEVTDILSAVLCAVISHVAKQKGERPEQALEEGYFKRLYDWLNKTEINANKAELNIPSAGKLVFEMKTRPSLRKQVRDIVSAHFSKFVKDVRDELELLNEEVRREFKCEGMVVIFDSLEKLKGLSDNWNQVLDSAEKVFGGNATYLQLPVHVIYTIPAALTNRINSEVSFLPMIKIRDKNRNPNPQGIKAARELIRKRIPDDRLREFLGDDTEARIKKLILRSGGYPRELVQMLQKVIAQQEFPISDSVLNHIITDLSNQYRSIVPGDAFEWLAEVANTKYMTIKNEDHRSTADLMLQNHAVLRYLNDELWFDVHPAIREIPGVQAAIAKLEAEQDSCDEG